ncbi:MAG: 50S ribosomal protein L18 [Cyanobacteria bacterium QS_8_64_29]|nr:MAG: 50S ribosomal protein L18 [Cyanobacteria bacterium QS_8_64_29]
MSLTRRNATRRQLLARRHQRVRQRISGTAQRPRLSVFRSGQHIYAQAIDDTRHHTLAAASTLDRQLREQYPAKATCETAAVVGQLLAERARQQGIQQVVFDRGGHRYHGRVKALADAAREGGLQF